MILFVDENSGILFISLPEGLIQLLDFVRIRAVRVGEFVDQIISAKEEQ